MNKLPHPIHLGQSDVLVVNGEDIQSLLAGKELDIIHTIRTAYAIHGRGDASLPHSSFLLFPQNPKNRIIALPAYLGGSVNSAGIKWISSFPDNVDHGIDRASAVLILSSVSTGRPRAILEGSVISAKRTAASAALAAQLLQRDESPLAGLVGCGVINFEIASFLLSCRSRVQQFLLFDLDSARADAFKQRFLSTFPSVKIRIESTLNGLLKNAKLVSFATTATQPYVQNLDLCPAGTLILHVSLRDLSAEAIQSSRNVVDDVDHVCRAQTSVHLAEQQLGNRSFLRCSLADVLNGMAPFDDQDSGVTVFSPFGLGILDVALGDYVLTQALRTGKGYVIPSFCPESWNRATTSVPTERVG
jgi:N-[(2S)-2-amino-2-carboxyethyl]-L-glutamate dehydrogenase